MGVAGVIRFALRRGFAPRAFALLETTGRRTGLRLPCSLTTMPPPRTRTLPYQWDAAIGRMMASAPLTVRIDFDPEPELE